MEDTNVGVLIDAKEEYTKQLISILKSCIYQGIKSIYMDAKDICHQDNTPDNVLMIFQDLLSRIPKWSQDIINKEFERISNVSKCDYIDDLLKVVYVSHIKILTVIHKAKSNKKLSLKVPSGSHFIHLCYIECAREFWKDPYLFSDRGSKFEQQKNMRDSENMISECISETIRKQLPVRNILKDFLNEADEDINEADEEDTDIKDPINKKYLKKLETVVKKELKTTNTLSGIDIDLIRQVIREEMEGKPLNTNIIKKELVDNVVEKIVEKSNEINEDFTHTKVVNDNTLMNNDIKKNKIKKEVIISNNIDIIPNTIETTTDIKTTYEGNENDVVANEVIANEVVANEVVANEVVANEVIANEVVATEEVATEENEVNENINISLENILNDNDNENIITNTVNDIETDSDINIEPKIKSQTELCINNIDEVNLNLDELDDNDCEEIDIDDLSSFNFNKKDTENSNEVKKTENTKYIFFNDAK
jgi:hypothetical protein